MLNNTKKFLSTIMAAVISLATVLCMVGCGSNESTGANDPSLLSEIFDPVSNVLSENSNNFTQKPESVGGNAITAQFALPNGDPVDLTNAVVTRIDGEISISEMTADNWQYVMCDYVYLAEPLGIFYNSIDNSDIFDENEMTFEGVPETVAHKYKKYKAGDMFGELKLIEAMTSFCPDWSFNFPAYFNGGSARFEGEITLTGKCRIAPEDDGYTTARDIQFVPNADNKALPIMNYSADENGNEALNGGMSNDYCWLGEYRGTIALGNTDNYSNLNFGDFPDDGSFADVKVTVNNFFPQRA